MDRGFAGGCLKNEQIIEFGQNKFFKFSCFSQLLKAKMAYKQTETNRKQHVHILKHLKQLQEEYTPKICLSKLKINRPSVRFHLVSFKKLILVGGCFGESGVRKKHVLCEKSIFKFFLTWLTYKYYKIWYQNSNNADLI